MGRVATSSTRQSGLASAPVSDDAREAFWRDMFDRINRHAAAEYLMADGQAADRFPAVARVDPLRYAREATL